MVDIKPPYRSGPLTNRLQSPYKGVPIAPPPIKMAEHPHSGSPKRQQGEAGIGSARRVVCPHKKTDFRHALWVKERKALRDKSRKTKFRVEMGKQPKGNTVTVDTSKARSNIDVLRLCVQELGWREYPVGKRDGLQCDIHWHSAHYSENPDLYTGWVNKFPGMVDVVKKVSLTRTLDIMRNLFPDDYNFHPQSWYLPQQFAEFSDAARRTFSRNSKRKPYYIVKPDEGSQGDGIYLITDPKDYTFNNRQHVVQEYLANPLLLEDLKFDLRIYVVVVRLDPIKIYLHSEGLARFCTKAYQAPSNKNICESFMHLTNYSLNKRSSTYVHTDTDDDGSKRTLTSVMKRLEYMGYDVVKLERDIEKLVTKTVLAIAPELKVEMNAAIPFGKPGPKCFQILGFDILITDQLKPMLLEVNANPSLRIDYEHEVASGIYEYLHSPVDEEIKKSLVLSTLKTIAPKKGRRRRPPKLVRSSSVNNIQQEEAPSDNNKSEAESKSGAESKNNRADLKPVRKYRSSDGVRRHHTLNSGGSAEQFRPMGSSSTHAQARDSSSKKQTTVIKKDDVANSNPVTNDENVDPADDGDEEEDEYTDDDVVQAKPQGPDFNPFDNHHLKEIYPAVYAEQCEELLVMDKTGDIFLSCLGVRGALRMGATSFRNFTRKGRLSGMGLNNAALDILFIDLQRRWEYTNTGNSAGLCYQGFLEAFFLIARRMFPSDGALESVNNFLTHCAEMESGLNRHNSGDARILRHPTYLPRLPDRKPAADDLASGRQSERNRKANTIDINDLPTFPSATMTQAHLTMDGGVQRLPSSRRYLKAKPNFVDGKE